MSEFWLGWLEEELLDEEQVERQVAREQERQRWLDWIEAHPEEVPQMNAPVA